MTPPVVGIDPSLNSTGVCDRNGRTHTITHKGLTGPERLDHMERRIMEYVEPGVELVVLEGYSYGSVGRREATGELGGVLRLALWRRHVQVIEISPITLKVYATGNSKAKKSEMVANARERLGFETFNEDEADALWLYAIGCDLYGEPLVRLPQTHSKALSGVRTLPLTGDYTPAIIDVTDTKGML